MLGFVLSLLIAFQGASTPAAGSTLEEELAAAAVYAGQEALAAREYRITEDTESGILLIQASVRVFGSDDEATAALTESVDANLASDAFTNVEEQDDPGIGDESQAFAAELPTGGFVGIVFVVQDTALFRFIGASLDADPTPELLEETEGWIADAGDIEDAEDTLDLLPAEDDVLDGFAITDEGSVTNDGEARPATPTA